MEGYQNCVEVDSDHGEVSFHQPNAPRRTFWYDKAYGQTSTGKTFTMEGDFETDINKGIIPKFLI
jgi:hypothetical protein